MGYVPETVVVPLQRALGVVKTAMSELTESLVDDARAAFDGGGRLPMCDRRDDARRRFVGDDGGRSWSAREPSRVLNDICQQGWELVSGSFVFVEQGQQIRETLFSNGQRVAIKGRTIGYYLFKRDLSRLSLGQSRRCCPVRRITARGRRSVEDQQIQLAHH